MTERDMADRVERAIQELRERDVRAGDAPALAAVLHRRRMPRALRFPSPARLALGAAVLIIAVLGYRAVTRPVTRPVTLRLPREVAALSQWRPITDVLLDTPGRQLLRDVSPLGRSIININVKGAFR